MPATHTSPPADAAPVADAGDVAGRLRLTATRLARLLRQQSDSGLSPTLTASLATVLHRGPLTLGALAEIEQVAPPTVTKVVDKLVAAGLVARRTDAVDRRITRVEITDHGRATMDAMRARKDAWLATRLADLPAADVERLAAALPVLERLAGLPTPDGAAHDGPRHDAEVR